MSPDPTSLNGAILGPKSQRGAFLLHYSSRHSSTHADPQQPWIPLAALTIYLTQKTYSPASLLHNTLVSLQCSNRQRLQQRLALQSPQLPDRHFSPPFLRRCNRPISATATTLNTNIIMASNAYHVIVERP